MMRDAPGTILAGKYELIEKAGAGGMAVVWRARTHGAAGFTRPVAIKRILGELARDPELVAMFVEEARVVSELQHPLIVQIHDFGVDEAGQHFLVMEWVEGVDLERLAQSFLAGGSWMPWSLVASIGADVLGALAAAHGHHGHDGAPSPIFHRDVTPQNILLSVDGFVKLADFGIARAMDRASMTLPNAVKGKLSYLSPERLRGKPASVQSDLFGLAVCLWECLAARRLFEAKTDMEVMFLVNDAKIPDVSGLRPDVPAGLWAALHTALAKDPAMRFQTAHAMARALSDLLRASGEVVDAPRLAECVRYARQRTPLGS